MLLMGGNSPVAVRRAARLGLGMMTQGGDPSLDAIYSEACREAGKEPGLFINPPGGSVMSAFVAPDLDAAWAEMGQYLLHDAQMYAAWMGDSAAVTKSVARSVDDLREKFRQSVGAELSNPGQGAPVYKWYDGVG